MAKMVPDTQYYAFFIVIEFIKNNLEKSVPI